MGKHAVCRGVPWIYPSWTSWTCEVGAEALDHLDIDDVMMDGADWKRGMQDGRQTEDRRQGGDFVCPAVRNTRIRANGQLVSHVFRVLGDNGGPLLGGTALNGGAHWGTLCLPLAQGTGPRRRGALSVRGTPPLPPLPPPKSPVSVLARREGGAKRNRVHLSRPFFFIFHFPSPFFSPPDPAFASSVKLAVALSPCSGSKSISCPGLCLS